MTIAATERRRLPRNATSHPVAVFDENGHLLGRGLTSNTSATGIMVITRTRKPVPDGTIVNMELTVPAVKGRSSRGRSARHSQETPDGFDRNHPQDAAAPDAAKSNSQPHGRRDRRKRIVRLRGRVIRTVSLGHLVGMGIELIENTC